MSTKTVVELDLVGYSDVARVLEENLDAEVVARFNAQIQEFINAGLKLAGAERAQVVLATTGDGAILAFDRSEDAHRFAVAVHRATQEHNAKRSTASSQRWFRIGMATGDLYQGPHGGGQHVAGTVIADAVRLETAARPGEVIADAATIVSLPADFKALYRGEETIAGKRDERFAARRYTVIPYSVALRAYLESTVELRSEVASGSLNFSPLRFTVRKALYHEECPRITITIDIRNGSGKTAEIVSAALNLEEPHQVLLHDALGDQPICNIKMPQADDAAAALALPIALQSGTTRCIFSFPFECEDAVKWEPLQATLALEFESATKTVRLSIYTETTLQILKPHPNLGAEHDPRYLHFGGIGVDQAAVNQNLLVERLSELHITETAARRLTALARNPGLHDYTLEYLCATVERRSVRWRVDPTERYFLYHALRVLGGTPARKAIEEGQADEDGFARKGAHEALDRLLRGDDKWS